DADAVLREHAELRQALLEHLLGERVVAADDRVVLADEPEDLPLGQRPAGAVDLELVRGKEVVVPSGRVLERRRGDQNARLAHEGFLFPIVLAKAWASRHQCLRMSWWVCQA